MIEEKNSSMETANTIPPYILPILASAVSRRCVCCAGAAGGFGWVNGPSTVIRGVKEVVA